MESKDSRFRGEEEGVILTDADTQFLKSEKQWSDIIPEDLAKLVVQQGFKAPSRIQSLTIPVITNRTNSVIIAQSPNCSGKTLAFLIPTLLRVDKSIPLEGTNGTFQPQAVVLTPFRDICMQTYMIAKKLEPAFKDIIINVGDPKNLIPSHVLICTPGNLLRILDKKKIDLSKLKVFAVDEADDVLTGDGNKAIQTFYEGYNF